MATKTFMDKQKTALVKKLHVLLGKAGIDNDGKLAILAQYGVVTLYRYVMHLIRR
jgi:hypothetical protein